MITTPPIMLKSPILVHLAIWIPQVSPIYLQLVLFLRRLTERTLEAVVFVHFSL